MSMLAEPKKKVKWGLNPRGNLWANDESKFGQGLLEKMGWKKGKGLGKHENGRVDNISVVSKDNNKGVGWDDKTNNWVAHQDDFNSLLVELNKNYTDENGSHSTMESTEDANKKKPVSLEVRSKTFKSRVHYKKFVSAKDTSQYSAEDMGCIFGKQVTNNGNGADKTNGDADSAQETKSPSKESDLSKFDGVSTYTSSMSLADYFAEKMKRKALDRKDNINIADASSSGVEIETELSVSQDTTKSKKRKLAEVKELAELNGQETFEGKAEFARNMPELEYLDLYPDYTTKTSEVSKNSHEGPEVQTVDCNSKDSDCMVLEDVDTVTFSEKATKKKKRKKQKAESLKQAFTEKIIIPDCKIQQETCVEENIVIAAASDARCNSRELDVPIVETTTSEDCYTEKYIDIQSNSNLSSSNSSHKERPQNISHREKNDSSQTAAATSNNYQKKQTSRNSTSKDVAERESDLALLWRYKSCTKNNLPNKSIVYNPNNTESWVSVLKSARKQAPYNGLENKLQRDKVLSTTNLLYMTGYGLPLFN